MPRQITRHQAGQSMRSSSLWPVWIFADNLLRDWLTQKPENRREKINGTELPTDVVCNFYTWVLGIWIANLKALLIICKVMRSVKSPSISGWRTLVLAASAIQMWILRTRPLAFNATIVTPFTISGRAFNCLVEKFSTNKSDLPQNLVQHLSL